MRKRNYKESALRLKALFARLVPRAWCRFCGWSMQGPEAAAAAEPHDFGCEKHPLNIAIAAKDRALEAAREAIVSGRVYGWDDICAQIDSALASPPGGNGGGRG